MAQGGSVLTEDSVAYTADFWAGKAVMNKFVVVVNHSATFLVRRILCHFGSFSTSHAYSSGVVQRFMDKGKAATQEVERGRQREERLHGMLLQQNVALARQVGMLCWR